MEWYKLYFRAIKKAVHTLSNRVIMEYKGDTHGPLLIVIGGIHGNELAGIKALSLVLKMLEVEPITNPSFSFIGKIMGLVGNQRAVIAKKRYIDQDLNRMWDRVEVKTLKDNESQRLTSESKELFELLDLIEQEVRSYQPTALYILDLHTTSSGGGIFSIPNGSSESLKIAKNLHAPVISDMLIGIKGTTLHYFNNNLDFGLPTTSVTFEAGQHDDPTSINRCIAAIINCLKSIGCVQESDVESIHDDLLKNYSKNLPLFTRLIYKHVISPDDKFTMKPGFKNFDEVREGDVVAQDKYGDVSIPHDSFILMPLYQSQGQEGFYLVKSC